MTGSSAITNLSRATSSSSRARASGSRARLGSSRPVSRDNSLRRICWLRTFRAVLVTTSCTHGQAFGLSKRAVIDGLENLDPAGLKHVFGQLVLAGDAPARGKKRREQQTIHPSRLPSSRRAVPGGILESGMLPPGPATPEDEFLSLVVGAAHYPNEIGRLGGLNGW